MEAMMQRLSIKGLGLALGVMWGAGVFLLGVMGTFGWGTPIVELLGSGYIGYGPSLGGSVIGGIWAFVDGAIGGIVLAWLYNRFCE
jgi:hypothetical protein